MTEDESEALGPAVVFELRSSDAIVRLNRPAERNSLSVATLVELDSTVSALTARPA